MTAKHFSPKGAITSFYLSLFLVTVAVPEITYYLHCISVSNIIIRIEACSAQTCLTQCYSGFTASSPQGGSAGVAITTGNVRKQTTKPANQSAATERRSIPPATEDAINTKAGVATEEAALPASDTRQL
jgi:hypothetical protein